MPASKVVDPPDENDWTLERRAARQRGARWVLGILAVHLFALIIVAVFAEAHGLWIPPTWDSF